MGQPGCFSSICYSTSCHASSGLSLYEMVSGRDACTPIEFDLGLSLKNPCSESEYAQSLRYVLSSIRKAAQVQLDLWSPYIPGTPVPLRHPKSWKFASR